MAITMYPWQEQSWQHFQSLADQNHLPHAVMLTGKVGIGKYDFAISCAHHLLSVNDKNQQLCASEAGHPDLLQIVPEGKMGIIKVDQVRSVVHFLNQTALMGGCRVVVVHQAERMNIAAANALLKTLEEPGDGTLLLLTATALDLVLPTIRSRCQHWPMQVNAEQAQDWLQQSLSESDAKAALALSPGAPLAAKAQFEAGAVALHQTLVSGCLQGESPLVLAEKLKDCELSDVVAWLVQLTQQMISQASGVSSATSSFAKQVGLDAWFTMLDYLYQAQGVLQKRISVNAQLFLEDLLIQWRQQRQP